MSMLQWFLPTVALLSLLGALWYAASQVRKRTNIGAGTVGPNALPIVGKRMLDQRKGLYVVQVADRYLLLGTSETTVGLIDHITAEEFAMMSAPEIKSAGPARGLRLARKPVATTTDTAETADADVEVDELAATGTDGAPQFATVGEAFGLLLEKARNRSGRTTETSSK